jgi:hypothetical protein
LWQLPVKELKALGRVGQFAARGGHVKVSLGIVWKDQEF